MEQSKYYYDHIIVQDFGASKPYTGSHGVKSSCILVLYFEFCSLVRFYTGNVFFFN